MPNACMLPREKYEHFFFVAYLNSESCLSASVVLLETLYFCQEKNMIVACFHNGFGFVGFYAKFMRDRFCGRGCF